MKRAYLLTGRHFLIRTVAFHWPARGVLFLSSDGIKLRHDTFDVTRTWTSFVAERFVFTEKGEAVKIIENALGRTFGKRSWRGSGGFRVSNSPRATAIRLLSNLEGTSSPR